MTDDRPPIDEPPAAAPAPPKRRRKRSAGVAIGGVIAGVDAQIFRTTPPAAELVESARPVRGLSGEDGTFLTIELPEDVAADGSR